MSLVEQLVESINKNIEHYKVELYSVEETYSYNDHQENCIKHLIEYQIFTNLKSAEEYQKQLNEAIKNKNKSKEAAKISQSFDYFYTVDYLETEIKPVLVNPEFDESVVDKNINN